MSTTKHIQTQISEIEAALNPIDAELNRLYQQFGAELVPDVEAWMRNSVKRRVEENASKINNAGINLVKAIKTDLAELIAQLPKICASAIEAQERRPHSRTPNNLSDREPKQSEEHSAASFRRAISPLGVLLAKHDLLTEKKGHISEWEKSGNGYRYAINPGFDERRFPALQAYKLKRQEQMKLMEQLQNMRTELEKAKARDLWDEA